MKTISLRLIAPAVAVFSLFLVACDGQDAGDDPGQRSPGGALGTSGTGAAEPAPPEVRDAPTPDER